MLIIKLLFSSFTINQLLLYSVCYNQNRFSASTPQAGLTVRAVQKYLLGTDMSLFTTEHLDGGAPTQPYPSNSPVGGTTETTETYQSPPFTENNAAPTYQVPIY